MEQRLVTIATFGRVMDADLARARLASAGIDCVLHNRNLGGWYPWYATAFAPLELQVRASDVPRAVEHLDVASDVDTLRPPDEGEGPTT